MIVSLLSTAAALTLSLPVFALGERLREREESRLTSHNTPYRKHI